MYAQLAPDELLAPGRLMGVSGDSVGALLQFPEIAGRASIDISSNKKVSFTNQLVANPGPDTVWVPDYPKDLVGPGYRSYLYQKMKGQR